MDFSSILNKIKQTGRSTAKERKVLRAEMLSVIDLSEEFVENTGSTLVIKYLTVPVAGLFTKNNYSKIEGFGYFKPLFEEDPEFVKQLGFKLTGCEEEEVEQIDSKSSGLGSLKSSQKITGLSFEYAVFISLYNQLKALSLPVQIVDDANYQTLIKNFNLLPKDEQLEFMEAGIVAAQELIKDEKIIERNYSVDTLTIKSVPDNWGIKGDVRDIVLSHGQWETGISCKNNLDSAKHSRLSPRSNFKVDWIGMDQGCSEEFLSQNQEIFAKLEPIMGVEWTGELKQMKEQQFYEPIMINFEKELMSIKEDASALKGLAQYIIGRVSYYKVIKNDSRKSVIIKPINSSGGLLFGAEIIYPTKIIKSDLVATNLGYINRLQIECDNGWIFNFRIHSASQRVENSFKFDIKIVAMPNDLTKEISFNKKTGL